MATTSLVEGNTTKEETNRGTPLYREIPNLTSNRSVSLSIRIGNITRIFHNVFTYCDLSIPPPFPVCPSETDMRAYVRSVGSCFLLLLFFVVIL